MPPAVGPCSFALSATSSLTPSLSSFLFCKRTLKTLLSISQYPAESIRTVERRSRVNMLQEQLHLDPKNSTLCEPSTAPQPVSLLSTLFVLRQNRYATVYDSFPKWTLFKKSNSSLFCSLSVPALKPLLLFSPFLFLYSIFLSLPLSFTGPLHQPAVASSRHLQGFHQRQRLSMHLSLCISLPFPLS